MTESVLSVSVTGPFFVAGAAACCCAGADAGAVLVGSGVVAVAGVTDGLGEDCGVSATGRTVTAGELDAAGLAWTVGVGLGDGSADEAGAGMVMRVVSCSSFTAATGAAVASGTIFAVTRVGCGTSCVVGKKATPRPINPAATTPMPRPFQRFTRSPT